MQFNGSISRKGVELQAYLVEVESPLHPCNFKPIELVPCGVCGGQHPKLYGFWRKPAGMLGCWVIFRVNGEEHLPDLSVFMELSRLPRDARPIGQEWWHKE
jgi:hypothetical protein